MEAALPLDDDGATGVDAANDAAIARPEIRFGVRDQLDPAADSHARGDAGGKETRTRSIHTL